MEGVLPGLGLYLGRYDVLPGPPVHRSATCEVVFAFDLETKQSIALKLMKNARQFDTEVQGRHIGGKEISTSIVVALLAWHVPSGYSAGGTVHINTPDKVATMQQLENTPCTDHPQFDPYPFVVVMERGERSLHDACNKERTQARERRRLHVILSHAFSRT